MAKEYRSEMHGWSAATIAPWLCLNVSGHSNLIGSMFQDFLSQSKNRYLQIGRKLANDSALQAELVATCLWLGPGRLLPTNGNPWQPCVRPTRAHLAVNPSLTP